MTIVELTPITTTTLSRNGRSVRNIFFTRQKITGAGVYFQGWHRATPIFVDIKDNEN